MKFPAEVKLQIEQLPAVCTSLSIESKKLDRLMISCSTYIMKLEYVQVAIKRLECQYPGRDQMPPPSPQSYNALLKTLKKHDPLKKTRCKPFGERSHKEACLPC